MAFPPIISQLMQYIRAVIAYTRLVSVEPIVVFRIQKYRVVSSGGAIPTDYAIPPDYNAACEGVLTFIPLAGNKYCVLASVVGRNGDVIESEATEVVLSKPELVFCWCDAGASKLYVAALTNHDDFCSLATLCFAKHDAPVWVRAITLLVSFLGRFDIFDASIAAFIIGVFIYLVA